MISAGWLNNVQAIGTVGIGKWQTLASETYIATFFGCFVLISSAAEEIETRNGAWNDWTRSLMAVLIYSIETEEKIMSEINARRKLCVLFNERSIDWLILVCVCVCVWMCLWLKQSKMKKLTRLKIPCLPTDCRVEEVKHTQKQKK